MLGNKDEYYYKEVKDYIENNKMQEFVFVHDKCTRDEWVELSINYDIMISNPFIDNTPVSLIEGMALGMCIVCTNVGGIPFLIEDRKHGILINNDSSDDLVTAINNLLNDPDLVVSLSQNGREKAEKHSWNLIKSQWLNLINS
jgi:glycosyltransferase involved in cell wall biosynthesis